MNKAELIEVVASRIDASKKDAAEAVQAVVDAITEAVAKGQKVSISGFGVFEKAARPARTYRKPSTGEAISKLATSVPKFRPGGDFKAFVSGEKNIADAAFHLAMDAGGDVRNAAGNVVDQARAVVGRPVNKAPAQAPAKAAAKAPAKRAAAPRAAAQEPADGGSAAPAKAAAPRKAPAKRTAKAAAPAAEGAAPAKKAPAKRTAKKAAAAPEAATEQAAAPVKRAPAKRAAKKVVPAPEQAPAAEQSPTESEG